MAYQIHHREIIGPDVFGRAIFAVFVSQKRQLVFSESKHSARKFVDSSLKLAISQRKILFPKNFGELKF